MRALFFDSCGLRVELRRLFFGLATLSLFTTAGGLAWNRAVASTYSAEGPQTSPLKPLLLMSPTSTVAGIQTGRVYAAKSPALVQTPHLQSVFNDRLVTDLKPTGSGVLDYQVTFLEPGSDTPTEMPAAMFLSQIGADVTDKLPPVGEGKGQTGTGYNWRDWATAQAEFEPAKPTAFVPGAGQPQANTLADTMPAGIPAAAVEGGEKQAPIHIEQAPAGPPAPAPKPEDAAGLVNNFANSDSDKPASTPEGQQGHPLSRSPSRTGGNTATTPTQATEKAAGVDESGGATAGGPATKARGH